MIGVKQGGHMEKTTWHTISENMENIVKNLCKFNGNV